MGSDWRISKFEDTLLMEDDLRATVTFTLVGLNDDICMNNRYENEYPFLTLDNDQPKFFFREFKVTGNEITVTCQFLLRQLDSINTFDIHEIQSITIE